MDYMDSASLETYRLARVLQKTAGKCDICLSAKHTLTSRLCISTCSISSARFLHTFCMHGSLLTTLITVEPLSYFTIFTLLSSMADRTKAIKVRSHAFDLTYVGSGSFSCFKNNKYTQMQRIIWRSYIYLLLPSRPKKSSKPPLNKSSLHNFNNIWANSS